MINNIWDLQLSVMQQQVLNIFFYLNLEMTFIIQQNLEALETKSNTCTQLFHFYK